MASDIPILNFDLASQRKLATDMIRNLRGLYTFDVHRVQNQASKEQHGYYWGFVVEDIRAGIAEAWGEKLEKEEVHVILKNRFLSRPVVDHHTGEVMGNTAKSTRVLDVEMMSRYLEECIKFAAEYLNVTVRAAVRSGQDEQPTKGRNDVEG